MSDKVARITKNPKFIRNICTSAHIHHGKCVSGDTKIILNNRIATAKEIYEEIASNGNVIEETEDHIVFAPNKEYTIFSLNKSTQKIEKRPIQYAWKLLGGETIKIKLRNGFEVETTPEHKYITFDGNFNDVEAKDLKLGDRIVCSRKLNMTNEINVKEEILLALSNENFYARVNESFYKEIKNLNIKDLSNVSSSIKAKSVYHGITRNRFRLADLINLSQFLNKDLTSVYDNITKIFYRTGLQRGHNSLEMNLPTNFNDFYFLAGLFAGDGSNKKFIVGKEELVTTFNDICKDLGINPKFVKYKNKTPEMHTNLTLVKMFNVLFDYPLSKKSHNIGISNFLFKSNDKFVASYLKGYFDTDGCIEKSRRAITISSASSKMIDALHLLLLRFGCIAIKEKDNTLSISGLSAINYKKHIGFTIKDKISKLNALTEKVSGSYVCDTISDGNRVMLVKKSFEESRNQDLAFIEITKIESSFQEEVYDLTVDETHNFVAEGMVIHNTAFTDNLLAASGHMASKNAGDLEEGMATWQHADEQERLMTVDAANVSMVHEYQDNEFLINLIDTPGHVDFGGNVTRAMRAVDGTVVLICAVEGIMPQTENVVKQAVRERVKPVLFINKVDRLVKELKLSPEKIQERFIKLISEFNDLIEEIAESEYKEKWKVNITDGSVAFGSARENWALSLPFMQKKGVTFKDILRIYEMDEETKKDWVWKNAALNEVILDMVIKHHPNPIDAQKYRIPRIWKGELDSEFGKDLINCNPDGKLSFVITRIVVDPKSGKDISAGRLFSGTLKPGMQVYLNNAKETQRVQNLYIYNGIKPELLEYIPCGNVCAISGIVGYAGETITLEAEHPFEALKHIFEPVITKSIEVKNMADLPKLVEVLRKVSREDPSIKIEINDETGENLMSGMGELHLEIIENRIVTEKGVQVKTSQPIVVYREAVLKKSGEFEGKSPNKHNKLYFVVEPIEDNIYAAIKSGEISEGRVRKKDTATFDKLIELGVETKEAKSYVDIFNGNVLIDNTRGIVHIGEIIGLVMDGFEDVMKRGILAGEPCVKMKVRLMDCSLHEDAIHRGPSQMLPAVRDGIRQSVNDARPAVMEPLQVMEIDAPIEFMGEISKLVQNKRGQLLSMDQEGSSLVARALMPVAEIFGWASDLRSATSGRGSSFIVDQKFDKIPESLQAKVIASIRQRKGLKDEVAAPTA
jgi:elongation factor 2